MATAAKPAAPPLPLLPLAPIKQATGLRIKRKPQISKFRPKDRKRFRPRARLTESSVNNEVLNDNKEEDNDDEEANVDSTTKLETREAVSKVKKKSKSRFSAFGRRPKPGVVAAADRRREEVPTKREEEKLETTLPHRQPTTLQASFILLLVLIVLIFNANDRQVPPPCPL